MKYMKSIELTVEEVVASVPSTYSYTPHGIFSNEIGSPIFIVLRATHSFPEQLTVHYYEFKFLHSLTKGFP